MLLNKIDHVGVAVQSLEAVKSMYREVFGLNPVFEEIVSEQKVRVAGFRVGESNIEYLEPTEADSTVARFLDKRGEGLHHLCIAVSDIDGILSRLRDAGAQLIDETPRIGAEGKRIAFVHPKSMNGMLLELSEEKPDKEAK